MVSLEAHWLGEVPYEDALALQRRLRDQVLAGVHPGALLLLTHPPTITLGRHGSLDHILGPERLHARGATIHRVERGGDVTYHGPGQLVAYPICSLRAFRLGIRAFILALSDALQTLLAEFGVQARWDPDAPGLWVGTNKIVAFGLHQRAGVTMHGFALNVCPDLSFFDLIVPCGLVGRGVTSLELLLQSVPPLADMARRVRDALANRLNIDWLPASNIISPAPSKADKR